LCDVAVLVPFRLMVRRTWIALMMLVALVAPISATDMSVLDFGFATALTTLGLFVLLRSGLVALIAMSVVTRFVTWLPLTLDTDTWYFGRSLVALLLIGSLATYGFLVALRGRSAFGVMEAK
jgi:hypothetical protein